MLLTCETLERIESNPEHVLQQQAARCTRDPLAFVKLMYPNLVLRPWQIEALSEIRDHLCNPETRYTPYRGSWSSGHGIGKTAFLGMVFNWGLSTMPGTRGDCTAGKGEQLRTKVGPEIGKWMSTGLNSHWFDSSTMSFKVKDNPLEWRCDLVTWDEEEPQNYAGLHNQGRRIIRAFDEAATIPDLVWEAARGCETDTGTQIIELAFSQCTRASGWFYEATFGSQMSRWHHHAIDSREVPGTNLAVFAEWVEEYEPWGGEESDFVRVRVRGLPPLAGDLQFISSADIIAAQKRVVETLMDDPLVAGLDLARGGDDECVLRFRRGLDAKSIPPVVIPGSISRDSNFVVSRIADELQRRKPVVTFCDESGGSIGGPIGDRLRQLGFNVVGIQFGGVPPDRHYADMRAYMWARGRDWLARGAIDAHVKLRADMEGPMFGTDRQDRMRLESKEAMKKRGLASPDHADALFLTFAQPVAPQEPPQEASPVLRAVSRAGDQSWMM